MSSSKKLQIYVCVPPIFIKKVIIPKRFIFKSLEALVPQTKEFTYILNGQDVHPMTSFHSVNIKNNDCVVVLNKEKENSLSYIKWIQLTSDNEIFNQKIYITRNPSCYMERNRLLDLRIMKNENKKKKFYAKSLERLELRDSIKDSFDYSLSKEIDIITHLDHEENEYPNEDPLPILWNQPTDMDIPFIDPLIP